MVLLPSIAALVASGADWRGVWLTACWALCYCLQFVLSRWIKVWRSSGTGNDRLHHDRLHHDRLLRYGQPVIVYAVVLLIFGGIPLLLSTPGLLRWAPIYVTLLVVSLLAAYWKRERSLWANVAAIVASCIMPVIICSVGSASVRESCAFETSRGTDEQFAACAAAVERYHLVIGLPDNPWRVADDGFWRSWWPVGSVPTDGLVMFLVFAITQFGSVLFVKTMIRERGNRWYVAFSLLWHAGLTVFGFSCASGTPLGWVAIVLLIRAAAMPAVARYRKVKPLAVGMVEIVASLLVFVAAILAVPQVAGALSL